MNLKRIFAGVIIICLLLSLCKSCAADDDATLTKLTVSEVTHSIFYAPMYAAVSNGYFAREGIELELVNAGGADKVMTSLLTGGADIGFAGPEAVVYVYAQGKEDYPQVFAQLTSTDGSFLVGRKAEENFEWQSVKGSTILPGRKGGMPYMYLLYVLKQNGLEVGKDVFFDESISFNAMTGAFVSGTGNYVTVFEPGATDLESQGKGYILASLGEAGGKVPYTTYFANPQFLTENRELVQKFTNAIYKGQQFVARSSAEEVANAISSAFPDTDISTIATVVQRYKDIGAYSPNPVMTEENFNRLTDILINAGELSAESNIPFDKIINNSFAEKAVG